jgi:hypothetical protein
MILTVTEYLDTTVDLIIYQALMISYNALQVTLYSIQKLIVLYKFLQFLSEFYFFLLEIIKKSMLVHIFIVVIVMFIL